MNPRTKERSYARGVVNFFDGVLNALDSLEQGRPLQEAIGEGFRKVRERQEANNAEPIGFKPPPVTVDVQPVQVTEVPYCDAHHMPKILCSICKARGDV